jgi:hypothetical protein
VKDWWVTLGNGTPPSAKPHSLGVNQATLGVPVDSGDNLAGPLSDMFQFRFGICSVDCVLLVSYKDLYFMLNFQER